MRIALVVSVLTVFVSAVFGQGVEIRNDPVYPLQIVSVTPSIGPNNALTSVKIGFRNVGQVPITALSASLLVRFSNSKGPTRVIVSEDLAALGYASGWGMVASVGPGQLYEHTTGGRIVPAPGTTVTNVEAMLDYVETSDGKRYGPDPRHVNLQFATSRLARRSERARLLKMYQDKGLNVLLDELGRR